MGNRAKATEFLANAVESLLPGAGNKEVILKVLGEMTDKQYADFVQSVKEGRSHIHLIVPNGSDEKLSQERIKKVADKLNIPIFEYMWVASPLTGRKNLSLYPRFVVDLPSRRFVQMLEYKLSAAKNNKHIDQRTDQATGESKASAISSPEINMLLAQGYNNSTREFVKDRGGDSKAFHLMENLIIRDGSVRQETLDKLNTRSKAPQVASRYFTAMHLPNNL